MSETSLTWGDVHVLYALAVLPLLVLAFALDGQRRRRLLERIGHLPMIVRMTASFSPGRRRWRTVLMVAGVTLLILALARPQMPGRAKLTESRGLDLVVALDFSKSMLARDVYPTRLDRAKAELARFIDTLHGDRVGLVAFAGETLSYPLTVDYEAAKLFWRDLGPDDMPVGGTDLGRAITAATELLRRVREREGKKRPAQLILLITDGEDTEGQGLAAARAAAKLGIKIYTLGIGSHDQPPVPLYDEEGKQHGYVTDGNGDPVRVGLDEAGLKQIALATSGDYTPLDPRRFGVERVQQAIAGLERTEEKARFEREPTDVARWFLLPAFLALVAAACVRERRRGVVAAQPTVRTSDKRPGARADTRPERVLAALILIGALPLLTGFDLLKRKDPNIEEGNRQLQAGHAEEALKAYDRAVEKLPEEPIAHFDRGVALYLMGKFPEAQKEFLRASEGSDHELKADAYYNMGNALLKQERFKDALGAYKHTLELRPDDRRAKWNLELALRRLKEEEQKKQQQQQQKNANNPPDKDQKPQDQEKQAQQDQQQEQQKQDPKQQEQQKQDQQKQEQQKQEQAQQEQQQQQQKPGQQEQKPEQQKQDQQAQQQADKDKDKEREKQARARSQPREIDKQDAEAVLDALERVEPTVQKDLARRRAGARRPTKDW